MNYPQPSCIMLSSFSIFIWFYTCTHKNLCSTYLSGITIFINHPMSDNYIFWNGWFLIVNESPFNYRKVWHGSSEGCVNEKN